MSVIRKLFIFILLILFPPFLLELIFVWPPNRIMSGIGVYLMVLSIWATVLISLSRFLGYDLQALFSPNNSEAESGIDSFPFSEPVHHEIMDITEPGDSTLLSDKPNAHLVALDHNNPFLPEIITLYEAPEIHIGRSPQYSDVVLNDMRISRIHATILYENNQFHIKDEGSSGGTFVNRIRINLTVETLLKPGDIVYFSTLAYRFEPIKATEDESSSDLVTEDKGTSVVAEESSEL